ncbi:MAG TPA: hypothetical protein ENJ18_03960 [Nannocystis exedens]|nr:hypothetical protein [Nannocystis exedens]
MSTRRQLTRSLVLPAIALLALSPLACKQKTAPEIPLVDDDTQAPVAEVDDAPDVIAKPEPEPPPSVHVRASARGFDDIFALIKQSTGAWTGEPFDVDAQAQAMLLQMAYGPGLWNSLNWKGLMAIDFQVPLTDDSLASDFRAYGSLAATNARTLIDSMPEGGRPQPLGDGIWEMLSDNLRVLLREQPTALEFAFVTPDLDRAAGLPAATPTSSRFAIVADKIPNNWLNARDFIDLPENSQAMQQLAAVFSGVSELSFVFDAGTERDLKLGIEARAPFQKLGLSPLGAPRLRPTSLEASLPGSPFAVITMSWGSPELLHKTIDRSVPMDQIPPPLDKLAQTAIGGAHSLLDQIQDDVAVAFYLTKNGRVAVLMAAKVRDKTVGAKALREITDSMVQGIESYSELVGGSAEASIKVTLKSGGGRLGRDRGDLLRIRAPKNMAQEAKRAAFLLNKKKEIEVLSGVSNGIAMLAFGGGTGELWANKKAGTLAEDTGLAQARLASTGCQLCLSIDPVGITRLIATIARDRSDDAKIVKDYSKVLGNLKKLGDIGDIGLGLRLQDERGAFALGMPRRLLLPDPAVATKATALFDRVWDAYFDGEESVQSLSDAPKNEPTKRG